MKKIVLLFTAYLITFTLTSCKEKMNKYNWIPTECAPETYPAEIYSGDFFYGDDKSIYVPKGREINYGWGEEGSIDVAGEEFKEAPNRLDITYISYTEGITYTGSFQLDKNKIESLFQKGFGETDNSGERITYDALKVGLAPGGLVVVWMSGGGRQIEVGHFQASPTTKVNWKLAFPDMEISIEEYTKKIVAKLPAEVQTQVKNHTLPLNRWKDWRKKYNWKTIVDTQCRPTTLYAEYFNAEQTLNAANGPVIPEINQLAIPKRMYVAWSNNTNHAMRTDINFDEDEVSHAFSQLKDGEAAELNIHINPDNGEAVLKLKTKEKEIPLEKTKTDSVLL